MSSTISFSGQSSFSADLQTTLNRALQIASQPMKQLQDDVVKLQSQQSALNDLETTFTALQSSITALSSAAKGKVGAYSSASSNVTASATANALPGIYSIQVDRVGSSATAMSIAGNKVIDPSTDNISTSSNYVLNIDGITYDIASSGTSLQALADALNSADVPVQATIVNVGGASGADYRLSLASTDYTAQEIQLNDGSTDLMDTLAPGVAPLYKVNGSDQITGSSNEVTLAPGLTVSLLQQTTSAVTITVTSDYSAVTSALTTFISAYNNASDALAAQRGTGAGVLGGQSVINSMSTLLRTLPQYNSGSSVGTLADFGVVLDQSGKLSFDATKAKSMTATDVQNFLGQVDSGGFVDAANKALTTITDSSNGLIHNNFTSLQAVVDRENQHIADDQSRIDTLQAHLQASLSAADAAIATLEAQKTYFLQLFQATYPSSSNG